MYICVFRIDQLVLTMSALGAIMDYIRENKVTLPRPLKRVLYSAQHVSRQFREETAKVLKGLHYVSVNTIIASIN